MTRNLKVLGLALVAALALSAVGASAASATFSFTAPEGAVSATGNQIGETQNVFTVKAGPVKCNKAEFSGTQEAASATSVTIPPHYTECTFLSLPTDILFEGCNYVFPTPTAKLTGEYVGAPPTVTCPAGKAIKITPTIGGVSACTVTVEAQTPTAGSVGYRNLGVGTTRGVTVEPEIFGVHYKSSKAICGEPINTTLTDGTYIGGATIRGYKHKQAHAEANHRAFVIE